MQCRSLSLRPATLRPDGPYSALEWGDSATSALGMGEPEGEIELYRLPFAVHTSAWEL
jgi:hypothetical protein